MEQPNANGDAGALERAFLISDALGGLEQELGRVRAASAQVGASREMAEKALEAATGLAGSVGRVMEPVEKLARDVETLGLPIRLEQVEQALGSAGTQIGQLKQGVLSLSSGLKATEGRLGNVEQRVTGIEARMTGVEQRLAGLEGHTAQLTATVQGLAQGVSAVYQQVTSVAQLAEANQKRIAQLRSFILVLAGLQVGVLIMLLLK